MARIRGWVGGREADGWGAGEWEGVRGDGGGWEVEGGFRVPLGLIQQQCVSSK